MRKPFRAFSVLGMHAKGIPVRKARKANSGNEPKHHLDRKRVGVILCERRDSIPNYFKPRVRLNICGGKRGNDHISPSLVVWRQVKGLT